MGSEPVTCPEGARRPARRWRSMFAVARCAARSPKRPSTPGDRSVADGRAVSTPPLVIFGIDAGDPEFLTRWAGTGDLPNLARIMERGTWGRTGGAELVSEHGVWVSIFSGISRRDYGYFYFRQMEPGKYDLHAVTGLDVDAPPFCVQIPAEGRRTTVLDIPNS